MRIYFLCGSAIILLGIWYALRMPAVVLFPASLLWLIVVQLSWDVSPRCKRRPTGKKGTFVHQENVSIPSSVLTISSFWEKNKSDVTVAVPNELTAFIDVVIDENKQTVKTIRFEGKSNASALESELKKIPVDGGYLFFGDQLFTEQLRKAKKIKKETLRICEPDAELPYAIFSEDEKVKAIVVLTGEGDDVYDLKMETMKDGRFVLSSRFLE